MDNDNFRDESTESGFKVSQENDQIDEKYGYHRINDAVERTGYLFNMHTVSDIFVVPWVCFCSTC